MAATKALPDQSLRRKKCGFLHKNTSPRVLLFHQRQDIIQLTRENGLTGFVTAWRFAEVPTNSLPSSLIATTEGVVRDPSEFSMTRGAAPSIIATQLFVVPKSMPMTSPWTLS